MEIILIIIYAIICYFIVSFIYVIGHAVTLLLAKGSVDFFVFGPLLYTEGKLKFNKNVVFYGGAIVAVPYKRLPATNKKYIQCIYSGPLTSLLLFVILIPIALITGSDFINLLTIMAFSVLLGSLLPLKNQVDLNAYTDDCRIINALKNNEQHKLDLKMYNISLSFDKQKYIDYLVQEDIGNISKVVIISTLLANKNQLSETEFEIYSSHLITIFNELDKKAKKIFMQDDIIKEIINNLKMFGKQNIQGNLSTLVDRFFLFISLKDC